MKEAFCRKIRTGIYRSKLRKQEEVDNMKEYEIIIETINPCGGERHSQQEIIEAEIESPEAYVKQNGRFPVIDTAQNPDGDVVIVTGDGNGYMVRYTFTE